MAHPSLLSGLSGQCWEVTSFYALRAKLSQIGEAEHFWQKRYYDFNIRNKAQSLEKLRYIHRNPVKRGFCERWGRLKVFHKCSWVGHDFSRAIRPAKNLGFSPRGNAPTGQNAFMKQSLEVEQFSAVRNRLRETQKLNPSGRVGQPLTSPTELEQVGWPIQAFFLA